jgi:hypothetical protein
MESELIVTQSGRKSIDSGYNDQRQQRPNGFFRIRNERSSHILKSMFQLATPNISSVLDRPRGVLIKYSAELYIEPCPSPSTGIVCPPSPCIGITPSTLGFLRHSSTAIGELSEDDCCSSISVDDAANIDGLSSLPSGMISDIDDD